MSLSDKQPESKIISVIKAMTINIDLDRKLSSSQFIRKYWNTYTTTYGNDQETYIKAGNIEIIKSNIFVESSQLRFLR